MSLQLNAIALLLAILILLGLFSQNTPVTISAAILLIMQQTLLSKYIPDADKYGLKIGIIILTIGVLAPLVSGRIALPPLNEFLNFKMVGAIVVGIVVAWLGGRGIPLMTNNPPLITGLMIGTVLGVAFFGGIPVGPLIAAGILSLVIGKG
ncbi:DUF441 family protein [Pasteurella atlantica]|uniref:DUF441 domain-containing protein n=1 Tax=Pasteurellaceae TaxID=712 RepID=UPI00275CFD5E|nr:DUF441 family protein [Pasteurella atlantica]MDP8034500.1 DUF441 family protein [Pasteurella atlantica]MDP8036432.1 DUF441 family protein [Pasteurella atlantica]MDP8038385.1 DUF441 family protein [Pasteurella atlantica]MDP8048697.1 DUF441 family protein [Pasteurella atlantica]MDP8050648.1 DUF441 family protein [Pasteurella atlantica]